jgi:hypothetical protein
MTPPTSFAPCFMCARFIGFPHPSSHFFVLRLRAMCAFSSLSFLGCPLTPAHAASVSNDGGTHRSGSCHWCSPCSRATPPQLAAGVGLSVWPDCVSESVGLTGVLGGCWTLWFQGHANSQAADPVVPCARLCFARSFPSAA